MPFVGELRPFQVPAQERMVERKRVLVAYRMGLGKTPITIAAVEELLDAGKVECGLVVAQSSLKYQWLREIDKFTGGKARVLVVDGDPRARERQYRQARKAMFEYVILSYDNIVRDFDQVELIPMDFMVCDEATNIKGFRSQRSKRVKQLRPTYRFALSGQPVENRPEELYSIMQWVDPKVLGNFVEFERTFISRSGGGAVRKYRNLKLLNKTMGDAMIRATWDEPEIQAQMPKVVEENEYVDFDPAAYKLYRHIGLELLGLLRDFPKAASFNLSAHYGFTDDPETAKARGEAMARITAMSMLCDSPALLEVSADLYEDTQSSARPRGSKYVWELQKKGRLKGVTATPKLDVLVERVKDQLDADPQNKIVVFCQHPDMLYEIRHRLGSVTECSMLTGKMTAKQRDASKQQFLNDKRTRVFLSSDAGGYGLDLPNANYLHNFDLPWSGGKLEQRNARIIRLSSLYKNVTLVNWMMLGSIEERRYDMLLQKQRVASAWVDGKGLRGVGGELVLTLGTLTDFLEGSLAAWGGTSGSTCEEEGHATTGGRGDEPRPRVRPGEEDEGAVGGTGEGTAEPGRRHHGCVR